MANSRTFPLLLQYQVHRPEPNANNNKVKAIRHSISENNYFCVNFKIVSGYRRNRFGRSFKKLTNRENDSFRLNVRSNEKYIYIYNIHRGKRR